MILSEVTSPIHIFHLYLQMIQLWDICSDYGTLIFAVDAAVMAGGRIVSSMTMLRTSLPFCLSCVMLFFKSPSKVHFSRRDGLKLLRQHISIISAERLPPGIVADGSLQVAGSVGSCRSRKEGEECK